jgi:hypothetical protein
VSAFLTWLVTGERRLPNGMVMSLTAVSFGATEGHARKAFQRLQELAPKAAVTGEPYYQWADEDLVFTLQIVPPQGGAQ